MHEWRRVALGDVIRLDVETVEVKEGESYPIVGVLNRGRGLLVREAITAADTKYVRLNRVRDGQVIYSKLKAFEGAITVAGELEGGQAFASSEFPTLTCGTDLLPAYVRLVAALPEFWAELASLSTGIGGRRERVSPKDFLTISLTLPPVDAQRRIVDLVASLDANIAALDAECAAQTSHLARERALVVVGSAPTVMAMEAFSILMGRQRSPDRATGPFMTPYLRSANVLDGILDLSDVKEMDFGPAERARYALVPGDVLVSEGSASESAVGAAAVWSGEIAGPVCLQNTLLRFRAVEGMTIPRFVYHWCRWAYESGAFRDASTGSNIRHIGLTRALKLPVCLPTLGEQQTIVAFLDIVERHASALRLEHLAAQSVRSAILPALLSGAIAIPTAYDLVGAL